MIRIAAPINDAPVGVQRIRAEDIINSKANRGAAQGANSQGRERQTDCSSSRQLGNEQPPC